MPDLFTIFLFYIIIQFGCLLQLILVQHQNPSIPGKYWIICQTGLIVSVILSLLRTWIHDGIGIALSNIIHFYAIYLLFLGIKSHVKALFTNIPLFTITILSSFIHSYFTTIHPNLLVRQINASFTLFLLYLLSGILLLRSKKRYSLELAVLLLFSTAINLFRICSALIAAVPGEDFFKSSMVDRFIILSLTITTMITAITILKIMLTYSRKTAQREY